MSLTLVNPSAERSGGEEGRDAGATSSDTLSQGALRGELNLQLSCQVLPLKLLVLADVRRDHALDLPRLKEEAKAKVVDASIVGDDGEVLGTLLAKSGDEILRDAACKERREKAERLASCRRANKRQRRGRTGGAKQLTKPKASDEKFRVALDVLDSLCCGRHHLLRPSRSRAGEEAPGGSERNQHFRRSMLVDHKSS